MIVKSKLFELPLFPFNVGYIQGCDIACEDIEKLARKWKLIHPKSRVQDFHCGEALGACYDLHGDALILIGDCSDDLGTLVHECTHAIQYAAEDIGFDDNETFAYLNQWLFNQILPYWLGEK